MECLVSFAAGKDFDCISDFSEFTENEKISFNQLTSKSQGLHYVFLDSFNANVDVAFCKEGYKWIGDQVSDTEGCLGLRISNRLGVNSKPIDIKKLFSLWNVGDQILSPTISIYSLDGKYKTLKKLPICVSAKQT